MNTDATPAPWMPGPWNRELHGCVFLPRMLEKGRRLLEGERQGRDLMSGYCFGDFDYADRKIFQCLRTTEARVLELLRANASDDEVAASLIKESGRSPPCGMPTRAAGFSGWAPPCSTGSTTT
jgi:hypothetical protein